MTTLGNGCDVTSDDTRPCHHFYGRLTVTADSLQINWLLFRRITGSKFNLRHLRCSAAMEAGEGTLPPPEQVGETKDK